jgi:hypothetical protein
MDLQAHELRASAWDDPASQPATRSSDALVQDTFVMQGDACAFVKTLATSTRRLSLSTRRKRRGGLSTPHANTTN